MTDTTSISPAGLPTRDQRSVRALDKLAKGKAVRAARQYGLLDPDEEVVGGVVLFKRTPILNLLINPLLGVLPGLIIVLALQRYALLIVTDRRVILTPWYWNGPKKKFDEAMHLGRPVPIGRLTETPRSVSQFGAKAMLAPDAQALLGRSDAYVQWGVNAAYAFRYAETAPSTST